MNMQIKRLNLISLSLIGKFLEVRVIIMSLSFQVHIHETYDISVSFLNCNQYDLHLLVESMSK